MNIILYMNNLLEYEFELLTSTYLNIEFNFNLK